MSLFEQKFSLVFLLIATCSSAFAQSALSEVHILCSATFPERPQICPLIYSPVCAPYPQACITTPCPQVQEFPSDCNACSDPLVESYTIGPCEETLPGEEEIIFEEGIIEEELILGEGTEDQEDIGEWENEEVFEDSYIPIACEDPRPELCTANENPVCVIECLDGPCTYTAGNSCSACADPNVLTYTPQSCEVERLYCPLTLMAVTDCPEIWEPVCVYSRNLVGQVSAVTAANVCIGCSSGILDYYIRGECPPSI